jgi:hypothetical protein
MIVKIVAFNLQFCLDDFLLVVVIIIGFVDGRALYQMRHVMRELNEFF